MRAKFFIDPFMPSFRKQMQIEFANRRKEGIRITEGEDAAVQVLNFETVRGYIVKVWD
jgi:hypothetical protein